MKLKTLGKTVRVARKKCGFTQKQLAKKLEIDVTYLSKIENDMTGYCPSLDVIQKLAINLKLSEDELQFLAGYINKETQEAFEYLMQSYPEISGFLNKMLRDSDFAKQCFDTMLIE